VIRNVRLIFGVSVLCMLTQAMSADEADPWRAAKEKALGWLAAQMVPNDIVKEPEPERNHLILSYRIPESVPARPYLYGRSMTYDNALAAIAFTMAGDWQNAAFILNALARLVHEDGSLWFGYNAHNSWPSEGDEAGALERSGAIAWAGYAAVFDVLRRQKDDPDFSLNDREARNYLKMAKSIAGFMRSHMITDANDPRYGLVTGGSNSYSLVYETDTVVESFHAGGIDWASFEHNIDAYFFLKDLALLSGDRSYSADADAIRKSLLALWSSRDGQYWQGAKTDRIDKVMALDCASWGSMFSLAVGKKDYARASLKTIEKKYRSSDDLTVSGIARVEGYKPYEARPVIEDADARISEFYFKDKSGLTWKDMDGVWGEGSLGVALAYLKQGDTGKARAIIGEMLKLQDEDGGVLYFTREIPHEFVSYPSVASTAWLAIVLSAAEDAERNAGFMGTWR